MDHVLLILSVKTSPTTAGDFYLIADVVVSSPPLSPFSGPSGKSLRRVSGGFFLACEYFFGKCATIHSPPALVVVAF